MKRIIDIPDEVYSDIQEGIIRKHIDKVFVAIVNGTPVSNEGDLISRSALKKAILEHCRSEIEAINHFWYDDTIISLINNAPSVDTFTFDDMKKGINVGYKAGRLTEKWERPQSEWIPVSERLPEDRNLVLVTAYWHETYQVMQASYFGEGEKNG